MNSMFDIPARFRSARGATLSRAARLSCWLLIATGFCMTHSRSAAAIDEGMWLFSDLPTELLAEQYDFHPDEAWTRRLMRASVRFNSGGSGSFVSSNGLVLTNHHVGSDTLQKLSSAEENLLVNGFLARTLDEERRAPDLELNQLISIECVTERVNAAITPEMTPAVAVAARRAVIADIEAEATQATGNRCNVVTLYGGGRYHLYEYKRFTDVRLVWAPEQAAALFGGDADNFEYPRYCLDACIFRVYEDDQPAITGDFLAWNDAGPRDGDLVFVSGNPGNTSRIFTSDALRYERDARMPDVLDFIRRREILLQQYSLDSPEHKRQAFDELLGAQNSRKAYSGMLAGLQDPEVMARLAEEEKLLMKNIAADASLAGAEEAWDQVRDVSRQRAELRREAFTLNTRLYSLARTLVRLAAEEQKPNAERLPEFRDSGRESLLQDLLSDAPVYPELERVKLADLIARTVEIRGADDPFCQMMLDGKSPRQRADQLVCKTRLNDAAFRQRLVDGGSGSIESSDDPLLKFARSIDEEERRLRSAAEELDEIEQQAYSKITEALFAIHGTSVYPDATFTLRLAFGVVKGYEEGGEALPPWTTINGAFEHETMHGAVDPWQLPRSWHAAREQLMGSTPLNFVCTADIIGGNSGSPVVNRNLELVGLIFDGNIQSLTSDYFYSEDQARAISVHAGAIREALRSIYGASHVADQLGQ